MTDHTGVDPQLGSLEDVDELIAQAHRRGLRVLLDLVPSHTSIEHPWFREHPDWYVWSEGGPANNWRAAFGGAAWTRDERSGRWYLHSFYPEQPDLDWTNPSVREAIGRVIRFWLDRGADGFRVDAVHGLAKDPELRDDPPASRPFGLPLPDELAQLDLLHSMDGPGMAEALAALRRAAGEAMLVGEVYLPMERLRHYLDHLDLAFAFEFLHASREPGALANVIERAAALERVAWVMSNHDFPRLVSRFGRSHARLAAMLLLTLPGPAFLYQGDEIGMADGPGTDPPIDRHGRDAFRHPMQWDPGPAGGFTRGEPWLPAIDPGQRSVAAQEEDPDSMLELYRALIALRPRLAGRISDVAAEDGILRYRRGVNLVALNVGDTEADAPLGGELILSTAARHRPGKLAPGEGVVMARDV